MEKLNTKKNKHTPVSLDRTKDPDKKAFRPSSVKHASVIDKTRYEQLITYPTITIADVEFNLKTTDQMPVLSYEAFLELYNDIATRGILVPVIVDEHNNVIDGRHRLIAAHVLKIKNIPFDVRPGLNESEKADLARDLNLHRRHLSPQQVNDCILKLRQAGKSYRQIGETLKISHETARAAIEAVTVNNLTVELPSTVVGKDGKEHPATATRKYSPSIFAKSVTEAKTAISACAAAGAENIPNKAIDLRRLERIARKSQNEQLRQGEYEDLKTGAATLLLGDFRTREQEIKADSIDMVLTDPPYAKEYLPLWADLGSLAKRALKPGGILLSYSGTLYLPQVFEMLGKNLQYLWTFAIYHSNGNNFMASLNVSQAWKPIIAFYKPPLNKHWASVTDMFSGGKEKANHEWQQSVEEAKYYLKALCPQGGTVLDPMMGSGTSIIAATELGFKAIGIEIDSAAYATAQERLGNVSFEDSNGITK